MPSTPRLRFCSHCGDRLVARNLPGEELPKHVCRSCDAVHYHNPRVIAGCLAEWGHRILLCRRAIEPARGCWTIPAGYMEWGETPEEAAARETREEAGAHVTVRELCDIHSSPGRGHVYLTYRADLQSTRLRPGIESLEADLFEAGQIPWDNLCHPAVGALIARYFAERGQTEGVPRPYVADNDYGEERLPLQTASRFRLA